MPRNNNARGTEAGVQNGHSAFSGRLGSGAVESVGITRLPAPRVGAGRGMGGSKPWLPSGEATYEAPACASSSAPSILRRSEWPFSCRCLRNHRKPPPAATTSARVMSTAGTALEAASSLARANGGGDAGGGGGGHGLAVAPW
eukprot:scaffold43824_cov66-Phaeocystis_antarctica.AAC.2